MEQLEERLIRENFEERARMIQEAHKAAIQEADSRGRLSLQIEAADIDPESIRQRARIKAYELLAAEMEVRKRLVGVPSLEKWAKKIGVHPSTVSRWRQDHEEFDAACADCEMIKDDILWDGGLSGVYNSRVVALMTEKSKQREREAAERSAGYTQMEDFED